MSAWPHVIPAASHEVVIRYDPLLTSCDMSGLRRIIPGVTLHILSSSLFLPVLSHMCCASEIVGVVSLPRVAGTVREELQGVPKCLSGCSGGGVFQCRRNTCELLLGLDVQ